METADGNTTSRRKTVFLTLVCAVFWAMPFANCFFGIVAIFVAGKTILESKNMLVQIGKLIGLALLFIPLCWLGFLPYVVDSIRYGNTNYSGFENFSYTLAAVGGIAYSSLVTWSGLFPLVSD